MIRHISIFFLKEENKENNSAVLMDKLSQMELKLEGISDYQVGNDCMPRPPKGVPGVPEFGDVVQIIDFLNEEDAAGYAMHPAHQNLIKETDHLIEKVVTMDIRF